jgi:hypothetical protein
LINQGPARGGQGPRSKSSTDGEAKPDVEESLEEVAAEQDMLPKVKVENKIEAGASSRQSPN